MEKCRVNIEGTLPRALKLTKAELKSAAVAFAEASGKRIKTPFKEVTIIIQDDEFSAEVHEAINGAKGPTDVITQRYDAMPGEEEGVYGELYVNADQALRAAPKRESWSTKKEFLLYVAHGMDHLSGADDLDEKGYDTMRKRELNWLKKLAIFSLSFITYTLSLSSLFAASEDDEIIDLERYCVSCSAKAFVPETGRNLVGASFRSGYYLNEFWAIEGEVGILEDDAMLGADVLWHWYGYERLDPFFTFGALGIIDGSYGPKMGAGAFYHLTDSFSLRADADLIVDLDDDGNRAYVFSLGAQYSF
ncbi:MAG: rRNA maturation RNase YbeY [Kiritimatiellae bacterium]|nr:rRNA maturation RNase YbeY [Kiritimatiellia bacterium]